MHEGIRDFLFAPDCQSVYTGSQSYDLAPNGKRIAALMPVEAPEAQQVQNHVIFLENFFDELRRRVPVSGK